MALGRAPLHAGRRCPRARRALPCAWAVPGTRGRLRGVGAAPIRAHAACSCRAGGSLPAEQGRASARVAPSRRAGAHFRAGCGVRRLTGEPRTRLGRVRLMIGYFPMVTLFVRRLIALSVLGVVLAGCAGEAGKPRARPSTPARRARLPPRPPPPLPPSPGSRRPVPTMAPGPGGLTPVFARAPEGVRDKVVALTFDADTDRRPGPPGRPRGAVRPPRAHGDAAPPQGGCHRVHDGPLGRGVRTRPGPSATIRASSSPATPTATTPSHRPATASGPPPRGHGGRRAPRLRRLPRGGRPQRRAVLPLPRRLLTTTRPCGPSRPRG